MNPEAFAYWLQGFFELTGSNELNEAQVKMIKEHLQLVFHKVTPSIPASILGIPRQGWPPAPPPVFLC